MKLLYVLLTQRTPRLASPAYYYGLEFYHGKEIEMMLIYRWWYLCFRWLLSNQLQSESER